MIALSDLDLLVVLAQTDLFHEALSVLNTQPEDILVTSVVADRAKSSNGFKNIGLNSAAKQKLVNFVNQTTPITDAQDIEILARLADEGIDSGEAILFAAACNDEKTHVVTGDKRAINDLANIPELSDVLTNRMICLENLFLAMFDSHGFGAIHQKVSTALASGECQNGTLKLCMKGHHTEDDARQCLASGINDLNNPQLLVVF